MKSNNSFKFENVVHPLYKVISNIIISTDCFNNL